MPDIKFTESKIINGGAETLFDFTQDYSTRLKWDTFLKQASLLNGAVSPAKDVKAWCVAKNGIGMETVYVSFIRPKVAAVKMTNKSLIFKSFLASWNFNELQSGQTETVFLYSFSLRFPFNLATGFITNKLIKEVKQRLSDLKTHFEKENIV
jgi:ribosome-associated toxin RatA of RatAB toxin-antitoxin module